MKEKSKLNSRASLSQRVKKNIPTMQNTNLKDQALSQEGDLLHSRLTSEASTYDFSNSNFPLSEAEFKNTFNRYRTKHHQKLASQLPSQWQSDFYHFIETGSYTLAFERFVESSDIAEDILMAANELSDEQLCMIVLQKESRSHRRSFMEESFNAKDEDTVELRDLIETILDSI